MEEKRSRGQELVDAFAPGGQDKPNARLRWAGRAFYVVPKGWFYQGDILMSKADEAGSSVLSGNMGPIISPDSVLQASNAMMVAYSKFGFLGRLLAPNLGAYAKRTAFAQESVDLARIAIALERYRLKQGAYPGSLDALAPAFMQEVPADIINGESLNYHLTPDGRFVLYSVGWNGKDDGGIASKGNSNEAGIDINRGDWVWQYPKQ
jgi:hypothetical protein